MVRATSAAFDLAGHQTSATDGDNRTITSTYDGGRLVLQTWRNADGGVQNVLTWAYDADGNLVGAGSNAGSYAMTYDGNRLMTRTDPSGLTLTYAYDGAGNVSSVGDSQGGVTGYGYDGGRVSFKTYHNGATAYRVDFTYDGDGGLLGETRYADLAGTVRIGSSAYGYDGGRLVSVTHRDGGGATLANYAYVYDTAGRLSSETDDGVTTGYAYDAAGQLTQAGAQGYTYDLDGNRNAAGNVVGPDNELLSDATATYAYDAAGQMVGQTSSTDGTSWAYGYDAAGNQTSAVQRAADGTVIQSLANTYDVFGNRIAQTVTTAGGTVTLRSVYDAANTLYADESNSGAVGTRYQTGVGGPDRYLARADGSGVETLLPDHLGSVRLIVSAGVLDRVGYGEFGNTVSETAPAVGGRLGFQGGELDRATGTLLFGARQFSPFTGRWGSLDPTGFGGGDANPYRFAGNGPTYRTDPTGLKWNPAEVLRYLDDKDREALPAGVEGWKFSEALGAEGSTISHNNFFRLNPRDLEVRVTPETADWARQRGLDVAYKADRWMVNFTDRRISIDDRLDDQGAAQAVREASQAVKDRPRALARDKGTRAVEGTTGVNLNAARLTARDFPGSTVDNRNDAGAMASETVEALGWHVGQDLAVQLVVVPAVEVVAFEAFARAGGWAIRKGREGTGWVLRKVAGTAERQATETEAKALYQEFKAARKAPAEAGSRGRSTSRPFANPEERRAYHEGYERIFPPKDAPTTGASSRLTPGGGLAAHEAAGGHTIARHVGRTDAQLAARLAAERTIPAASTFADRAIAERSIAEALDARAADVQAWLTGSANRLNPPLRVNLGYVVGSSLPRGAASSTSVQSVLIVLQRDATLPTGYRIVTAYPVP